MLPTFSERLSQKAERALVRLGVRVRSGVSVTNIDADGVTIKRADGAVERLPALAFERGQHLFDGGDAGQRFAQLRQLTRPGALECQARTQALQVGQGAERLAQGRG